MGGRFAGTGPTGNSSSLGRLPWLTLHRDFEASDRRAARRSALEMSFESPRGSRTPANVVCASANIRSKLSRPATTTAVQIAVNRSREIHGAQSRASAQVEPAARFGVAPSAEAASHRAPKPPRPERRAPSARRASVRAGARTDSLAKRAARRCDEAFLRKPRGLRLRAGAARIRRGRSRRLA
jgi:hypothetical protein